MVDPRRFDDDRRCCTMRARAASPAPVGRGGRHAHAGQPAGHRLLRPRGLPHRSRVPDDGSRQGRGEPGRHRLLRPPPHGGGPGHRHGDRHADRRGDGPAAGEGQGPPVGFPTRARVQHVHRRVEHHQLPVLPRAGRRRSGQECAATRPPRRTSATRPTRSRPGRARTRPRTASPCPYGELATKAAVSQTRPVEVELKAESAFTLVGKPTRRIDALDIVTGRKKFTQDLEVPDAKPIMVCRPPTINGKVGKVNNLDVVKAMPGITDVVPIASGIAVRGETFGQCIDAVNALQVDWGPGPKDKESDETVKQGLKAAAQAMQLQPQPGQEVVEAEYTFAFATHSPLQPNAAIADVKADRAEIWSTLKLPIAAHKEIAKLVGLEMDKVTVHVITGGGSFGRRLFYDGALEAAEASKKMGKPVKLMWHRADDVRHGRTHPAALLQAPRRRDPDDRGGLRTAARQRAQRPQSRPGRHPAGRARADDQRGGHVEVPVRHDPALGLPLRQHQAVSARRDPCDDRGPPAAERVQHRQHAQRLLAAGVHGPGAVRRQAGGQVQHGPAGVPQEVRQARQGPHGAGQDQLRLGDGPAAGCRPGRRRLAGAQAGDGLHRAARLPPRDGESQGSQGAHRPSGHQGGVRHHSGEGRRQPAGHGSADPGRVPRRRGLRTDGQPAPRGRSLPGGQLGQLRLHPAVERAAQQARDPHPAARSEREAGRPGRNGCPGVQGGHRLRLRQRHGREHPLAGLARTNRCTSSRTRPSRRSRRTEEVEMPQHTFRLNGEPVTVDVPDDHGHALGHPRRARRHRAQVRVRHQRLQGLHLPPQRRGVQPLPDAGQGHRARRRDHHDRRTPGHGRQAPASHAGGVARVRRRPVRLLPARPDHGRSGQGQRAAGQGPGDHRRRPRRDPQRLPLRHLLPHPRGHQEPAPRRCERSWPLPRSEKT